MDLAIATDYSGEARSLNDVWSAVKETADHGITHVHWEHEWQGDYFYSPEEMITIKKTLDSFGMKIKGVHASAGWKYSRENGIYKWPPVLPTQSDYASLNESIRRKGALLIRNRLELANTLETSEIVLHLQLPYYRFIHEEGFKDSYYRQVHKSIDEVVPVAKEYGIRICFENLVGTPDGFQIESFDSLFARYDASVVGFCFDTGHAQLTASEDPLNLAKKYQPRLFAMHLNDNNGRDCDYSDDARLSACDKHYVMGDGIVDFQGFSQIVANSPYSLPVISEFNCYGDREEFFSKTIDRMSRFSEDILNARKSGV